MKMKSKKKSMKIPKIVDFIQYYNISLLLVSAVSASSWRFRGRGARARTCEIAAVAVDAREVLAVREGIQRPCGSKESKYRQRCQQGVQVSDGLGGQCFKLVISRPRGAGTDL